MNPSDSTAGVSISVLVLLLWMVCCTPAEAQHPITIRGMGNKRTLCACVKRAEAALITRNTDGRESGSCTRTATECRGLLRHHSEAVDTRAALGFQHGVPAHARHTWLFVGGQVHSGTTVVARMLRQHKMSTGIITGCHQDEGVHLQTVFPTGNMLGKRDSRYSARGYHLTEVDYASGYTVRHSADANVSSGTLLLPAGARLFCSWLPYMPNVTSSRFVVEKSPLNIGRFRFLQAAFSGAATHFIATLRHPFGVYQSTGWGSKEAVRDNRLRLSADCGKQYITPWLEAMRTFKHDAAHVANLTIVIFEKFTSANDSATYKVHTQDSYARLLTTVGLDPAQAALLSFQDDRDMRAPGRRKLLGLHGQQDASSKDTHNLLIYESNWTKIWSNAQREGDQYIGRRCQQQWREWEPEVREYGYSLLEPGVVRRPTAFPAHATIIA